MWREGGTPGNATPACSNAFGVPQIKCCSCPARSRNLADDRQIREMVTYLHAGKCADSDSYKTRFEIGDHETTRSAAIEASGDVVVSSLADDPAGISSAAADSCARRVFQPPPDAIIKISGLKRLSYRNRSWGSSTCIRLIGAPARAGQAHGWTIPKRWRLNDGRRALK